MTSKESDRVDGHGLVVDSIGFNDAEIVAVNRKGISDIAGDGHKAKAVAFPMFDVDDGEVCVGLERCE